MVPSNDILARRCRLALPADAPAIAALHAASWRSAYRDVLSAAYLSGDIDGERAALWQARFAAPEAGQRVVVAESKGAIKGFACAFVDHKARWGTLLDNLHVSPSFKRQGLGASLVAEIASVCLADAVTPGFHLWVLEPNHAAQAFYRRLGARLAGRDTWQPPGGGEVAQLLYTWDSLASAARGQK